MKNKWLALSLLVGLGGTQNALAAQEENWGIAAMYRTASIPFDTQGGDQTVSTFVPMMFFDNEYVFIRGIEGGAYLWQSEEQQLQFNALTRLRFIDIPKIAQNSIEGDKADFGAQLKYQINDEWRFEVELMSDDSFRFHSNYRLAAKYDFGDWELEPSVTLRYKDADFNSTYYAFSDITKQNIGAGVDTNIALKGRYHVISNLYLLGQTSITRLDNNAYNSDAVEDRYEGEFYVGFGFFNDKTKERKSNLKNKPYLRVAHGWGTPSNIGEIFKFEREKDPYNNQLTSVFYGHPLTDELFGLPLDLYLHSGIAHHWSSEVQSSSTETVVSIKAYYTFNWPTQWRFGVAEGMSYIDNITYIEQSEMDRKGYTPSHLLNYLDFSFDVNVGDLVGKNDWKNVWFGYSLHHRSAIFEKASQFGRIKGGSNYNTIYVQFDF
ncbi:MipA/OmpV family protein [Vibrio vulnificus]|uniref:MipA/OmpV family protein n=1 Tax=Vibrio vulnificus TaxID=672 RepID=UPI001A28D38C|nr:MipA/OmpV family protein [Vibrio vulnificus]MCA3959980.1 MipA/OmpV family protein [Vibrio vulnificus]HAS6325404.1 MipA/OmpV family protein [Vibrio vulnificus]HDY7551670.1 MipA/OmpV family protein [Vibrio vulnificus]